MSGAKNTSNDRQNQPETIDSSQPAPSKKFSGLPGTILLVLLFIALIIWIRFSPAAPPEVTQSNEPETKSAEQQKEDLRDSQINDALDNFLAATYPDWQQQGKSFDDNSSDEDRLQIFDVQLANGSKNQIIKIFVEKFQKDNDSGEYWFAYQPQNQQIPESQIKLTTKKSPVENSSEKDNSNTR